MATTKCIKCQVEIEPNNRFCSILCQHLHHLLVEKMIQQHEYKFSFTDPKKCALCKLTIEQHKACDFCDFVSQNKGADIFFQDINGTVSATCATCLDKHNSAVTETNESKAAADTFTNKVGLEYVPINYAITYRQELYNSKVQSIEELRKSCADEPTFINALTARYDALKDIIHNSNVEQLAIAQRLRDIGALHKDAIRSALRASDEKYQPAPVKKVTVKVKKQTMSPMERIIQSIALAKGISLERARLIVMDNPDLVNSLTGNGE